MLPILQQLAAKPANRGAIRTLIVTPTRELAAQIAERISAYGRYVDIRHTAVYGGVSQHRQEVALRAGVDVLVATPGRLLDSDAAGLRPARSRRAVRARRGRPHARHGLRPRRPAHLRRGAEVRQTLLFSATIPQAIESLARGMLHDPVRVSVKPKVTTAENVEQSVIFVAKADKRDLLKRLLEDEAVERVIVFTRTKHGANRLSEQLQKAGIGAAAIHGNKSQGARERALGSFKSGGTRVLVATDVAARGIDVDGISHVINFDLPNVAESYVHRIGRTGRAGAAGRAVSFCDRDERPLLADIERLIRQRLPVANSL